MIRRTALVPVLGVVALSAAALATPASAHGTKSATNTGTKLVADLDPLNNSGVSGIVRARVKNENIRVGMRVFGAAEKLPHAQHIHFGEQARHECPTVADDTSGDFLLTTAEGLPAYGPIAVSLTTTGDTSPASGLAVDRFPVANTSGNYSYFRKGVRVMDTEDQNAKNVAKAIREGKGVVVVHGVDFNNNGMYDFESRGVSDLTPGEPGAEGVLPEEATAPAACGVLMPR